MLVVCMSGLGSGRLLFGDRVTYPDRHDVSRWGRGEAGVLFVLVIHFGSITNWRVSILRQLLVLISTVGNVYVWNMVM